MKRSEPPEPVGFGGVPAPAAAPVGEVENTSGQGKTAVVPPQVGDRWHWGAFGLTFLWGAFNRCWIGLITIIPIPFLGLIVAVYLGARGRQMAWRNKRWPDVETFNRTQRRWSIAGVTVTVFFGGLLAASLAIAILDDPGPPLTRDLLRDPGQVKTLSVPGEVQITVPAAWEEVDLSPDVAIEATSPDDSIFLSVVLEDRGELPEDIIEYSRITRGFIDLENRTTFSGPTRGRINGYQAVTYEITGAIDGVDVTLLHTVVATGSRYFQVALGTGAHRYDGLKPAFEDIVGSLRPIEGGGAVTSALGRPIGSSS